MKDSQTLVAEVYEDEMNGEVCLLQKSLQDLRDMMPMCQITASDGKRILDIYITSVIRTPMLYSEAVSLMSELNEGDEIHLWLHTIGGHVDSAAYLIHAMNQTKAKTIGHAVGEVMSAGTMILVNCDEVEISPFAVFMYHSASTIIGGKVHMIKSYTGAVLDYANLFMEDIKRKGYLTEEEFAQCTGEEAIDVYLTGAEVKTRLAKKETDSHE